MEITALNTTIPQDQNLERAKPIVHYNPHTNKFSDAPQLYTVDATIATGASLSAAVDLSDKTLVGIIFPSALDSATAITFQNSVDGTNYYNVYQDANEYSKTITLSAQEMLLPAELIGLKSVKVRLGTAAAAVTATADRVIKLIVRAV